MKLYGLLFLLCCALIPARPAFARADANPWDISVEELENRYEALRVTREGLETKLNAAGRRYANNPSMRPDIRLSGEQRRVVTAYLATEDDWKVIEPVVRFRDDLVKAYVNKTGKPATAPLRREAAQIALLLFAKTHLLRDEFNMSPIPIWQNMLVNMKIRERGVCHHWAHALLEYVKPLPREHFSVTWSESNPGTQLEHNVATIFPKGGEYSDGLFFDPWRTGGDPFWRPPLKDKHFNWKKRPDYEIY